MHFERRCTHGEAGGGAHIDIRPIIGVVVAMPAIAADTLAHGAPTCVLSEAARSTARLPYPLTNALLHIKGHQRSAPRSSRGSPAFGTTLL